MVDRISDLPDEVLCDILSFLPTQEAVKTSVLSKRWRHLWTSVPALDFDDQTCLKDVPISYFERIVHTTILARDVHQPITSFRLKYDASSYDYKRSDYNRSNADLNVWVNTATRCGIQNLDIEIFPLNYMIRLRSCILSCKTLVVLKLSGLSLNVSSSVELPSLKTLHLTNVEFVGLQYLIKLISGCPMLEDLETVWLDYDLEYDGYVSEEGFKLPNLVRAYIRSVDMVGANMLLKAACNTEFLILKQVRIYWIGNSFVCCLVWDIDNVTFIFHIFLCSVELM
ncbi:FBD-associated F-box protein At5g38590-like [Lotus japonicus]|uniref:FBD-associated F-box protein At5g38590-like n=1 Tax=Lotus japonicus TaxID=34305 RepID=UPI00258AFCB4|nr:FBD-associated F-box protein At5g38590-like [Lotus japonicus]